MELSTAMEATTLDDFLAELDYLDEKEAEQGRIWALSDIHTDHAENLEWIRSLEQDGRYAKDTLLLAGDVSDKNEVLRETLASLAASFATVFFVPGNHDLWVRRESEESSLDKLAAVLALCSELGVRTRPAFAGGAVIVPLLSWYHSSWDTEPDITGWKKIPPIRLVMRDFSATRWPEGLECGGEALAEYFDALNDGRAALSAASEGLPTPEAQAQAQADGAFAARVAALRDAHPGAPTISLGHFVPRVELSPEKRYLFLPTLAKAIGSAPLGRRVAALRPDMHIFGHTHFGWDATLDGVRYIQPCLAYPQERRRRLSTVAAGESFPHGERPQPLLLYASGFAPRYAAGWSNFYRKYPRQPHVTHLLPPYSARMYEQVEGVGEVGWGGVEPAWTFGPENARGEAEPTDRSQRRR